MNPMSVRDLRPPEDSIRISRQQALMQAYEVYRDENTPEDLTAYQFTAPLSSLNGAKLLTLTEGDGISRPDTSTVMLSLSASRVAQIPAGQYRLLLLGSRNGEPEGFVTLHIQLE